MIRIKEQLESYRVELIFLSEEVTDKRTKLFLKDTIDIIQMQIHQERNENDQIVCKLARSITKKLRHI